MVGADNSLGPHLVERGEGEPGIDSPGPVAGQKGEVVHLAGLARLNDEPAPRPRPLANEMVVDAGRGQQRWHDRHLPGSAAVGEDEDRDAVGDRLRRLGPQLIEPGTEAGGSGTGRVEEREGAGDEARPGRGANQRLDPGTLGICDHRRLQTQQPALLGAGVEEVPLTADRRDHRRDDLLADGVERGIGDLREKLLEVVGQELRPVGEDRQRGVVAHRAERLGAVGCHRREDHFQILERVAVEPLELEEARALPRHPGGMPGIDRPGRRAAGGGQLGLLNRTGGSHLADIGRFGEGIEANLTGADPFPPRLGAGKLPLDLVILDDPPFLGVDEEHLPGTEPPLADDVGGGELQHPGFAGHHHQAILHLPPAPRPQSIAIERSANPDAVGEGQRRRAIPRLHQAGLIFVVGLEVVGHRLVSAPWLGDEHADRLLDRAAAEDEDLEDVVEGRRIAPAGADDRKDLLHVGAVHRMGEHALAGVHPVDVAADGVDLAVVGEEPERMGEIPGGEGVRAVALVDEGEGRHHPRIGEVGVKLVDLIGQQQPFVDDRPGGEGADVGEGLAGEAKLAELDLEALADHKQLPLELIAWGLLPAPHERLPNHRLDLAGRGTDGAVVDRHGPPAEELLPLFLAEPGKELLSALLLLRLRGEEDVADGPVARSGKADAGLGRDGVEEFLRHLDEDAGPVAGERIAPAGPAVGEVFKHLEPLTDDLVTAPPMHVDDKPNAAGIVLVGGIVEPLGRREAPGPRRGADTAGHRSSGGAGIWDACHGMLDGGTGGRITGGREASIDQQKTVGSARTGSQCRDGLINSGFMGPGFMGPGFVGIRLGPRWRPGNDGLWGLASTPRPGGEGRLPHPPAGGGKRGTVRPLAGAACRGPG